MLRTCQYVKYQLQWQWQLQREQQHNSKCVRGMMAVRELPWCASKSSPNRQNIKKPSSNKPDFTPIDSFGIVAAMSRNHVIGVDGKLPWNIPEDRTTFKKLTHDNILIIGRRTFEEEPDQSHIAHTAKCIVVSKSLADSVFDNDDRLLVARSFPESLHIARELVPTLPNAVLTERVRCWIAGGEKLYHEALLHPSARLLHLTVVDTDIDVDKEKQYASFPKNYRWENKYECSNSNQTKSSKGLTYTHYCYERIKGRR